MVAILLPVLMVLTVKTARLSHWKVQTLWVPHAAALVVQVDARPTPTQATAGVRLVGAKLGAPRIPTPMVVRHHTGAKRLDGETRHLRGVGPRHSTLGTRLLPGARAGHRTRTRKTSQRPRAGTGLRGHPLIRRSHQNVLQVTRHHDEAGGPTTG